MPPPASRGTGLRGTGLRGTGLRGTGLRGIRHRGPIRMGTNTNSHGVEDSGDLVADGARGEAWVRLKPCHNPQ